MMKLPAIFTALLLLNSAPAWAEITSIQQFQQDALEATQTLTESVQEVLINALSLTGIKYSYGGKSPETGFDCSGFVRYVFQQSTSMTLPHGAKAISQLGQPVSQEQLQPGDLVFFNTLKSAFSHVGIYLGDHKFIHSPSSGGGVQVVDMTDNYWSKRFNGARRIENNH